MKKLFKKEIRLLSILLSIFVVFGTFSSTWVAFAEEVKIDPLYNEEANEGEALEEADLPEDVDVTEAETDSEGEEKAPSVEEAEALEEGSEGPAEDAANDSKKSAEESTEELSGTPSEEAEEEVAETVTKEVVTETTTISQSAKNAATSDTAANKDGDQAQDAIYLDPKEGDDNNPGTKDAPVKTFDKAKALLLEKDLDVIYIMNTISAAGSLSLPSGKMLKRAPGFTGALISVDSGNELTLEDITIDGDETQTVMDSLVEVLGILNVHAGSVLRNNKLFDKHEEEYSTGESKGGAIYVARNGILNFVSGIIEKNYADLGGGVYVAGTMNMDGGEIRDNIGGDGGAIHAGSGGQINLNDGLITNNKALVYGGGISVGGANDWSNTPKLIMKGGTISENDCNRAGGGIFIQANSYGYIGAGDIIDNSSGNLNGLSDEHFTGGGIYVNGGYKKSNGVDDGVLELGKVFISDNISKGNGGGIANCPSSTLSIYMSNGVAIGKNYTTNFLMPWMLIREDMFITSKPVGQHSGNPTMYLSSIMLGGGKNGWINRRTGNAFEPIDDYFTLPNDTYYSLRNDVTDEDLERGFEKALVRIIGNSANRGRGGGIGSNGIVRIGVEYPEYGSLKVSKEVSGDEELKNKEFTFTVTLDYKITGKFGDMEFVDGIATFTLKDGESLTALDLIPDIEYTVEERDENGFLVSYKTGNTGSIVGGEESAVEVLNTQTVSVKGHKTWDDKDSPDRPSSITVRLYGDGEEVAVTEVSADSEWSFEFANLPKYKAGKLIEYTVEEDTVEGYEVSYDSSTDEEGNTSVEIKNTKPEIPDEPDIPRTGEPEPPTPDKPEPPTPDKPEPKVPSTPGKTPKVPQTGDENNILLWGSAFMLSVMLYVMARKVKKDQEK